MPAATPSQEEEKIPVSFQQLPSGNGLDSPSFRNLPPEAYEYLEALAEAFLNKDREFLISQGESQYEEELRFLLDEDAYLALLYRCGSHSEDSEWGSPALPLMNINVIRAIEYTEWEENGPMLDIKGRLHLEKSDTLPCRIVLVWRLPEPRILGERP